MNEIEKLCADDDSTSFSCLPEDIVFQILNKLIDLKTLCLSKLVSKRFYRIVSQVEAISYTFSTISLVDNPDIWSYGSAIGSLMQFEKVKSIRIQLPSSFVSHPLFKWKFIFEVKLHSFLFLSPDSVYHNKESYVKANGREQEEEEDEEEKYEEYEEEYEDMELSSKKYEIVGQCLKDAVMRIRLLVHLTQLPLLKKISITDSSNRGKVSLSGEKVAEWSDWLSSPSDEPIEQRLSYLHTDCKSSMCYVPLLELPVSGHVMKGVYLYLMDWSDLVDDTFDRFTKSDDDFEDKDDAVYSEAMVEIFKNHRGKIERLE